ncbi:hypothetical protein [Stenotrophomonas chelatiphaga]|uniref:hypothetical protein n=1 Tax=Stenotrophomonas chelatiphaga TaxID=517011 RepID=UPI00289EC546|nr:hypothetical protein [Stenotrophomonas chelatiphaga]
MSLDPSLLQAMKRLNDQNERLHDRVGSLDAYREAQEAKQLVEAHQKALDKAQSASESYTKIIIAAGYAGFLAFWTKATTTVPQPYHAWIGSLFLLSLVLFITWEITKSTWSSIAMYRFSRALAQSPTPEGIKKFQADAAVHDRRMNRLWLVFLIPCVALGLASALWLLTWYVLQLWATL